MMQLYRMSRQVRVHLASCATKRQWIGSDTHVAPGLGLSDGSTFNEEYVEQGVLGSGGFAVVKIAKHRQSGKQFAVKVIPKVCSNAAINPVQSLQLIRNELSCMREIGSSLNAVRLVEAFESKAEVSLVMELCRGGVRLGPSCHRIACPCDCISLIYPRLSSNA